MKTKAHKYRCSGCKSIVMRESDKAWVKSFCEQTGKTVHLQRVK